MKHDDSCEWTGSTPSCRCAQRAFLADCTEEEKAAFKARRGYDTNHETRWGMIPRRTA